MTNILPLTILLMSILGAANNIMAQEQKTPIDLYFLKVEMNDAIATVYLNDAPIVKSLETDGFITVEPVNQWLISNKNTLSYRVLVNDDNIEKSKPYIKASLFLHDPNNESPTPKNTISEIEFLHNEETNYPSQGVVEFEFNYNSPTKLWDEAIHLSSLTIADKEEILHLAQSFSDSIINKNYNTAIEIQKYKIKEDALAEGKAYSRLEEVTKKTYDWVGTQGNLTSIPINPDEIDYILCGNNKLVYIQRANKDEVIILESKDLYLDIATFYAKINGKWTIVR